MGGERNWDYRYSWVRDASLTMEALWVAACPDEADDFFAFMATAAASGVGPDDALQIMFGVGGEHDLSERTLGHLSGWRDSAPVRVGNGAWDQQQVDVYGELLGAASRLTDQLHHLDADTRRFLAALADAAAVRWREPDQGIWEVRGDPRHFTYSKVMCWVALDRAVALADVIGDRSRVETWERVRDEIAETVVRDGWSDTAGAFTQYAGTDALDASTLMLPLVGFLPASDPRVLATIDAIEERLTDDRGLVYRYRTEDGVDGLAGEEGTFLLCTFWLAQALAMAGRAERAREVFERAAGYVNDVGLLAEEVDPATGELLGNFPQAFSHIGLVNAAWAIAEAEQRAPGRTGPGHGNRTGLGSGPARGRVCQPRGSSEIARLGYQVRAPGPSVPRRLHPRRTAYARQVTASGPRAWTAAQSRCRPASGSRVEQTARMSGRADSPRPVRATVVQTRLSPGVRTGRPCLGGFTQLPPPRSAPSQSPRSGGALRFQQDVGQPTSKICSTLRRKPSSGRPSFATRSTSRSARSRTFTLWSWE